jgi:hypothetical protein
MFFSFRFFLGGKHQKATHNEEEATHNEVKPVRRYRYNDATYEPKSLVSGMVSGKTNTHQVIPYGWHTKH